MKTLFTNATVIDGTGSVQERWQVITQDERFSSIGPAQSPSSDFDATYDLSGHTLLPGLIDAHVHFGGGDYDPAHEAESEGLLALRSLEAAQRSLMAGFTTVRSSGARHHLDLDVRDAINEGIFWGPRVLASGRGITHTGGHADYMALLADGAEEVRKAVRMLVRRGVDNIKLFGVSAGVATAGADVNAAGFSVEEIASAVVESQKFGKLMQVHSISLAGTKNAIAAGVRSIDHGHFLDEETCEQMKKDGIVLVPTFGPGYYYVVRRQAEPWRISRAETVRSAKMESFRMALDIGVTVAMGSDLGAMSRMKNGENALELALMVEAGMKPAAAIVAATATAARLLRVDDSVGTIEPGKQADLVVVEGNPLDDIHTLETDVRLVMRRGKIYRNELN